MRRRLAATLALAFAWSAGNALAIVPRAGAPKATPRGYTELKTGDTTKEVISLLGRNFSVCTTCAPVTWIYETGLSDPSAIVVRFRHGALASAFPISELPNV